MTALPRKCHAKACLLHTVTCWLACLQGSGHGPVLQVTWCERQHLEAGRPELSLEFFEGQAHLTRASDLALKLVSFPFSRTRSADLFETPNASPNSLTRHCSCTKVSRARCLLQVKNAATAVALHSDQGTHFFWWAGVVVSAYIVWGLSVDSECFITVPYCSSSTSLQVVRSSHAGVASCHRFCGERKQSIADQSCRNQ